MQCIIPISTYCCAVLLRNVNLSIKKHCQQQKRQAHIENEGALFCSAPNFLLRLIVNTFDLSFMSYNSVFNFLVSNYYTQNIEIVTIRDPVVLLVLP